MPSLMILIFAGTSLALWLGSRKIAGFLAFLFGSPGVPNAVFPPNFFLTIFLISTCYVLSLVFAGMALYILRRSFRLIYGVAEIFAAIGLMFVSMYNALGVLLEHSLVEVTAVSSLLQIAAALYVFVRGMDNTSIALHGTRARSIWDKVFPGTA